ncbi:hypothetical protein V5G20_18060 [Brevibacillus borstelensis]|uniref:hypothetical protein n=1 Tax=Brevibacillus borstelensis TaxID=45462 RepID=UPI0030D522DF
MTITQKELVAIRERAERATPGPWALDYDDESRRPCVEAVTVPSWGGGVIVADCAHDVDAEFITHAREDIPKLLAEIERLRRLVWVMNDEGEYRFGYTEWYDFHEGVNERLEGMRNE